MIAGCFYKEPSAFVGIMLPPLFQVILFMLDDTLIQGFLSCIPCRWQAPVNIYPQARPALEDSPPCNAFSLSFLFYKNPQKNRPGQTITSLYSFVFLRTIPIAILSANPSDYKLVIGFISELFTRLLQKTEDYDYSICIGPASGICRQPGVRGKGRTHAGRGHTCPGWGRFLPWRPQDDETPLL